MRNTYTKRLFGVMAAVLGASMLPLLPAEAATSKPGAAARVQGNRDAEGYFQWRVVGIHNMRIYQGTEYLRHTQVLAMRKAGLTEPEITQVVTALNDKTAEEGVMVKGMRFGAMSYSTPKGVVVQRKVMYVGEESHRIWRVRTSGGRVITIVEKCDNIGLEEAPPAPPKVTVTYTPPPTTATPPPVAMEPVFERQLVEVDVVDKAKIEYEAIAGVYVGTSRLYTFRGGFAEGSVKIPVGDNTSLLVGGMAMMGSGESRVSSYRGNESRFGPQIGLQHVYLKTHTVDGLEMQLPAADTLKIRYLWDRSSGSNPDSGYSFRQRGTVLNLYAEHVERINPNTLVGVTGEAVIPLTSSIKSTWSGDRPQNRSYYAINGFVQKRIDDDWQVRYIAGLAHQGWDKVNYLSIGAELRWKETVMCGPRLSLALNRPDSYRPYGIGSLHTLMAYCRLELGGTVRTMDRRRREKQWQLVQVGMRPVTREESSGSENSLLYIPPINAPLVNSNLTIDPALPSVVIKTPIKNIEE